MLDRHSFIRVASWLVLYLLLIDVAVNVFFPFPSNPQKTPPSFLQGYFEYGRSTEGKFLGIIKAARLQTEPTLDYGWLQKTRPMPLSQRAEDGQTLVAVYGMSHTKLLGEAMARVNRSFLVRSITAPGAPVGWSYAAYKADENEHDAKVVILGVMTDSVPLLGATSGATAYFDLGHPYTFPRYRLAGGKIKATFPPFLDEKGFIDYLQDPQKWGGYRDWLSNNDKLYNPVLFRTNITDHSSILRLIRRSYADMMQERRVRAIYGKNGFNPLCEEVAILRALIVDFAQTARSRQRIPIVYIVNNEGRSDHLYKILKPTLDDYRIPYLSTHIICPPDDPRVFLGVNSHFKPEKDVQLAEAMIKVIEAAKNGSSVQLGGH